MSTQFSSDCSTAEGDDVMVHVKAANDTADRVDPVQRKRRQRLCWDRLHRH